MGGEGGLILTTSISTVCGVLVVKTKPSCLAALTNAASSATHNASGEVLTLH